MTRCDGSFSPTAAKAAERGRRRLARSCWGSPRPGCGVDPAQAQQGGNLPGVGGGQLSAAELAQGTHIIIVWASWSPRCRDISPRVNDLVQKLSGQGRIVTVNFQEEAPAIEEFVRQYPLQAPVFLDRDGEFSKGHAVTTLPGLVVLRKGEVVFQGRLAADAEAQIQGLLK